MIHARYETNPRSRFAVLCALVEDHSFCIDSYKHLTIDWAQTPNGQYYSNKAPGPVLLALPAYWAVDKLWTSGERDRATRDHVRISHMSLSLALLSFLFQALPFAVLTSVALAWLQQSGASAGALQFSCVGMLFGNTAALFMNTYFGHGLAAVCVLGLVLCLVKRLYVLAGLAYSLALLTDYSSALLLPGFVVAALLDKPKGSRWGILWRIGLGGLLPAVLWVTYHVSCFGGPFALPYRYQNPRFIHTEGGLVLGIFSIIPQPTVIAELLFGFKRGIIWSQPWLLIVLVSCFWIPRAGSRIAQGAREGCTKLIVFLVPGVALLLWMNASFAEWQGGSTPGPRYLCSVFPAFALLAGLLYDRTTLIVRRLLKAGLAVSVLLWILVFSTGILVRAGESTWGFAFRSLVNAESPSSIATFVVLVIVFEWQLYGLLRPRRYLALPAPGAKPTGPVPKEP